MAEGAPAGIDLDRVRQEIDDEVRARRAAGDFPADMERSLDLAFARVSPVAIAGDDLDSLLQAADRASFVDPSPPTESRIAAYGVIKKTERRLLGWYFTHLAHQVTTFAGAAVRTMQVLTDRLEQVEQALPRGGTGSIASRLPAPFGADLDGVLVGALAGVEGRLLVTGHDPGLLDALVAASVDAYTVGPDDGEDRPGTGPAPAHDRRTGDPLDHLGRLAPEALGGVVLVGLDPLATATKLAFVEAAARALADGGRLVVVGARPDGWEAANPVEADLAPGRPFRPETWLAVVGASGFADAAERDDPAALAAGCHVVVANRRR